MGYMAHHAIAVTSWDQEGIEAARAEAVRIFGLAGFEALVTPLIVSTVNMETTFFVAPDGSKEGWDTSDAGDRCRAEFVKWLWNQVYEDGSSALRWVEVRYGDDQSDMAARVLNDCNTWPTDDGPR